MEEAHLGRRYFCTICRVYSAKQKSQCIKHVKVKHLKLGNKYNCPLCKKQFGDRWGNVKKHIQLGRCPGNRVMSRRNQQIIDAVLRNCPRMKQRCKQ